MDSYIFPIKVALITFPFVALMMTVPIAIYQYRKYKYVNKIRMVILYSFMLYSITAYYLVILPLPSDRYKPVLNVTKYYQLMPFNFINDFLKETHVIFSNISTYIHIFKERSFLQVIFNVMLLMPLGVYVRYYFKKGLKKVIIISFLVSSFFEFTQLTGLYGLYKYPYRLFDIDDLILNTIGGILGYFIAPMFIYFLPNRNKLDEKVNHGNIRVSFSRRFIALIVDWLVINIVLNFFKVEDSIIFNGIAVFFYFILGVYLTNGKTIGKMLVKIKIKGTNKSLRFKEVFKRYGILYYGIIGVSKIGYKIGELNEDNTIILAVSMLGLLVYDFIIFIHFSSHILFRKKQFFYEKVSETINEVE